MAVRPWNISTEPMRPPRTHDTPEQMELCDSCILPECDNCHSKRSNQVMGIDRARFAELYDNFWSDRSIAEQMGVPERLIRKLRKILDWPPNE